MTAKPETCSECGLTQDEFEDNALMAKIVWSEHLRAWVHYRCHVNAKFGKEEFPSLELR